MKVALLQLNIEWEDKKRNFDKVESLVERVEVHSPDLIVLPELFSTGYTMNSSPFAEDLSGETPCFLSKLARDYHVNVIGSFIEKTESKPKNSAILLDREGKLLMHYSKTHLPSFLGENDNYTAGNKTLTCELEGRRIGMLICYDLRFPEPFRMMADDAEAIFVIANWPSERTEHWDSFLNTRATENQLYIVGVNRVGNSPPINNSPSSNYLGHSVIIDPFGKIVAKSKENEEDVVIGEIDFSYVREIRAKYPILRDRRSDLVYIRL
jgi:omega-amidase